MAGKSGKKRSYSEAFLEHGFVNLPCKGEDRPQCVICMKVLVNESLKPSKLAEHLSKCHPEHSQKGVVYFQQKAKNLKGMQLGTTGTYGRNLIAAVEASYVVAYKVTQLQKSHNIAETLIMPCAKEMVSRVCGEEQAKKLNAISLSNNTIRRRIDDMAQDILTQVVNEVKSSPYAKFSLQFDESTDVSSCAVLLGFIRYVHLSEVKEEFLMCEYLTSTTRGADVFNIINEFFKTNELKWDDVHHVSVDGAPAMMGGKCGLRGLVQKENPDITFEHCFIHRFALSSKSLPTVLKEVFDEAVKIVNFIKSKDVNSRLFKEMCKEMGEMYEVLLYHTEVRWLSRGKVLSRLIDLQETVKIFLQEKNYVLSCRLSDHGWLARLCYLADIFTQLNQGNLQLQGKNVTIIDTRQAVSAFLGKVRLWCRRISNGVVAQFSTLDMFLDQCEDGQQLLDVVKDDIIAHLNELAKKLEKYYPDLETAKFQWCLQPFSADDDAVHDNDFPAKEEWIALRVNANLRMEFQKSDFQAFWIARLKDTPTLARRALQIITSFSTTYRCEQGFSTVLGMKTKQRNRLDVSNDARLALSITVPRIEKLAQEKCAQPSH
jgi:hypothetical protein